MSKFTPGQRVQIVSMPEHGSHLIGQRATVLHKGAFSDPGDVMVKTDGGQSIRVDDSQIIPIEE